MKLKKIKKTNPDKYNHVILGGWLNKSEGVIFSNWIVDKFIDTGYSIFGQDFGFSIDPTTLVHISINKDNKVIYAKELLYKPGLSTSEIYDHNL